jgi:hypothetical protein
MAGPFPRAGHGKQELRTNGDVRVRVEGLVLLDCLTIVNGAVATGSWFAATGV